MLCGEDYVEVLHQPFFDDNGFFSDVGCDACGGSQSIADNFAVSERLELCEIILWGGYFPGGDAQPDNFTLILHEGGEPTPGTVLYQESGIPALRTLTGTTLFGVDRWQYVLTPSIPLLLDPGSYWVQIFNDTGAGTDDWFWETGLTSQGGLPYSAFAPETPGSTWTPADLDLAMAICGRALTDPIHECTKPPPGVVSWWPGEGDAGDLWGRRDGVLLGTTSLDQGLVERAFTFDHGVTTGVLVADGGGLRKLEAFTIEVWVRANPLQDGADIDGVFTLIDKSHDDLAPSGWYLQGVAGTGLGGFGVALQGAPATTVEVPFPLPLDDAWHHVVGSFDGAALVTYWDGIEAARVDGLSTPRAANAGQLNFGYHGATGGRSLRGALDEVTLYRRALDPGEVAALWNSGARGKSKLRGAHTWRPLGALAWWPMEGGLGDLIAQHDGVPSPTTSFADWRVGRALVLDEDLDEASIPDDPSLDPTAALTVEFWMRAASLQDGASDDAFVVVDKSHGEPDDTGWYFQGVQSTGALQFGARFSGGPAVVALPSITDDTWHHVAGTYDGVQLRAYLDGILVDQTPASGALLTNDRPLNIGFWHFDGGRRFRGAVDELALFGRALSASEVSAIHAAGPAGKLRRAPCEQVASLGLGNGLLRFHERQPWVLNPENGHWYRLTDGRFFGRSDAAFAGWTPTWKAAQQEAGALGGYLVKIEDQAENDWLVQTFSDSESFWIGLSDHGAEGTYTWTDGSIPGFLNLINDLPEHSGLDEDAVHINVLWKPVGTGLWDDLGNEPGPYAPSAVPLRALIERDSPPWP